MTTHYVTDQIWFPCDDCGKQITHHSIHTCSPQIRNLTDKEIELLWDQSLNEKKGAEQGFSTQTDYFNYNFSITLRISSLVCPNFLFKPY